MKRKFDLTNLPPGAVLLYRPDSFFGWCIAFLTAGMVSHVEMYKGGGISYASRDHRGVSEYSLRTHGLIDVRYARLNMGAVAKEFARHNGNAYDYGTIARFLTFGGMNKAIDRIGKVLSILSGGKFGWKNHADVCSELIAWLVMRGGLPNIFGDEKPDSISPRDFQKQSELPRWVG